MHAFQGDSGPRVAKKQFIIFFFTSKDPLKEGSVYYKMPKVVSARLDHIRRNQEETFDEIKQGY